MISVNDKISQTLKLEHMHSVINVSGINNASNCKFTVEKDDLILEQEVSAFPIFGQ